MLDAQNPSSLETQALLVLSASRLLRDRASWLQKLQARFRAGSVHDDVGAATAVLDAARSAAGASSAVAPPPAEKVARIGIARRPNATYRITRDGRVAEFASGVERILSDVVVQREREWIYFLDDEGDVCRRTVADAEAVVRLAKPALFAHSSLARVLSIPRGTRLVIDERSRVAAALYEPKRDLDDVEEMTLTLALDRHGATWLDASDIHPAFDSVTMVLPGDNDRRRQVLDLLGLHAGGGATPWALALHCPKSPAAGR